MSEISSLFTVAGVICMTSFVGVVLRQAGREDGAQILSLITTVICLLMVLGFINEMVSSIRNTFWF